MPRSSNSKFGYPETFDSKNMRLFLTTFGIILLRFCIANSKGGFIRESDPLIITTIALSSGVFEIVSNMLAIFISSYS
jgi:hypothetical protein